MQSADTVTHYERRTKLLGLVNDKCKDKNTRQLRDKEVWTEFEKEIKSMQLELVSQPDHTGQTVFESAVNSGNLTLAGKLLDHLQKDDTITGRMIYDACLLHHSPLGDRWSLMHFAASNRDPGRALEAILFLVEWAVKLNKHPQAITQLLIDQDRHKNNAAQVSAIEANKPILSFLLEAAKILGDIEHDGKPMRVLHWLLRSCNDEGANLVTCAAAGHPRYNGHRVLQTRPDCKKRRDVVDYLVELVSYCRNFALLWIGGGSFKQGQVQ